MVELAPLFQASLRFFGATLLLGLWCQWRKINLWQADASLFSGLLVGLLFAAEFAFLYIGLQHASASRLTLFLYTSPFFVALLLPRFVPAEKLRWVQWLGLLCAFLAVALAMREGWQSSAAPQQWLGDVLALLAGLSWGLTTVVIRAAGLTRIGPEKLLFYQVGVSTCVLPILSWGLGEPWVWHFSPFAWGSLILQTGVGAFASYLVWMWMLGRYPATRLSAFAFLTPVFALIMGSLWLKEPVTPTLLGALLLVAVGIVLVNQKSPPLLKS